MQFLRAVSHSVGAHAESLQPRVDNRSNSNSSEDEDENRHGASCCEVCIVAPRASFALVPCNVDSIHDDAMLTKKTFRN